MQYDAKIPDQLQGFQRDLYTRLLTDALGGQNAITNCIAAVHRTVFN